MICSLPFVAFFKSIEQRFFKQNTQAQENIGVLFTSHLLDNLPNWLDRLFEGSTHRYHINYWPEFPVK